MQYHATCFHAISREEYENNLLTYIFLFIIYLFLISFVWELMLIFIPVIQTQARKVNDDK